jgi:hypothetical protein
MFDGGRKKIRNRDWMKLMDTCLISWMTAENVGI